MGVFYHKNFIVKSENLSVECGGELEINTYKFTYNFQSKSKNKWNNL